MIIGDDLGAVRDASARIADAIRRRDTEALHSWLAPDFVHRTHGGPAVGPTAFLAAVAAIPGEIQAIELQSVEVDACGSGILVTGVQHARVVIDGQVIDDTRGFVDWFVKHNGQWRIQAAVDLPAGR
jgi:ketosteroid isomerase-like protein